MTAALTAIKNAYEQEDMSPDEIADCQGLDVVAVKAGLMQCSAKYRKDCGHEEEKVDRLNFSDDQLERINQGIMDLALGAEDEHLRFKALTYVRDDKKGRKDIVKSLNGGNLNILMINEQLKKVREVADGIKQGVISNGEPINV